MGIVRQGNEKKQKTALKSNRNSADGEACPARMMEDDLSASSVAFDSDIQNLS